MWDRIALTDHDTAGGAIRLHMRVPELRPVAATGPDAHALDQLGRTWMTMERYCDPRDFLSKLRRGTEVVTPSSGAGGRG